LAKAAVCAKNQVSRPAKSIVSMPETACIAVIGDVMNNATARLAEGMAVREFFSFATRESLGSAARTEKRNTSPLTTQAQATPAHFDQTTGSRWKRCGIVSRSIHMRLVYPSARWPTL